MIAVVVAGYRGDVYAPGCIASLGQHLPSGVPTLVHFQMDDEGHGMAWNVQQGFEWALDSGADFVFWVEEDFRFFSPIPLAKMRDVLKANPHLAQVVLKRQPWSAEERAAGGQIEVSPGEYTQRDGYVEHRRLFSLNPSLIRAEVLKLGWPSGGLGVGNESGFTDRCLAAGYSFGYYGRVADGPLCEHVGHIRGARYAL